MNRKLNAHLENRKRGHNKFYDVKVTNRRTICAWGRIGSWMRRKSFVFGSTTAALAFALDKIDAKLARGYVIAK